MELLNKIKTTLGGGTSKPLFNQSGSAPMADNDNARQVVEPVATTLLQSETGIEDEDVFNIDKLDNDQLAQFIGRTLTVENFEHEVDDIISTLRELEAKPSEIIDALRVNLALHLSEAREVYKEARI